jgi:hypothetical protein
MDGFRFFCLDEVGFEHSARHRFMEMFVLSFLGFLIPFAVGHPQFAVGVLVNALLVRSALSLPSYRTLPVVFTPALGALARGLLFGPFTLFLAYLVPFIWAGNFILVIAFKLKLRYRLNYWAALLAGSAAKAVFLYSAAWILYEAGLLPVVFLSAMGLMQFATAVLGGALAYVSLRRNPTCIPL